MADFEYGKADWTSASLRTVMEGLDGQRLESGKATIGVIFLPVRLYHC